MSNSINEAIKGSLLRYLQRMGYDAVEVTSWEDTTKSDGYCETCWYEYAAVDVTYVDSKGKSRDYEYMGGFAELINQLD